MEEVRVAMASYTPVTREISTEQILNGLKLENIANNNAWGYSEDPYYEDKNNCLESSKKPAKTENVIIDSLLTENDAKHGYKTRHTHHQRVCKMTLVQLKNSLPRYNRYLSKHECGKFTSF